MNMIVKQVYDIIRSSPHFAGYNVYMEEVPEEDHKKEMLPIMRITEIDSRATGFASNRARQHLFIVQVDVWHKTLKDINDIYFVIDDVLAEHRFINSLGGTDKDIDFDGTPRMYKRYRTRQNKK